MPKIDYHVAHDLSFIELSSQTWNEGYLYGWSVRLTLEDWQQLVEAVERQINELTIMPQHGPGLCGCFLEELDYAMRDL